MNKEVIIPIFVTILLGLAIFVSAQSQQTIDNFSLSKGWNLVYGLTDPEQITGQGSNSQGVSAEQIKSSIELIYAYDSKVDEYILLYAKRGTIETGEYKNFNPPEEIPESVMWVYSERTYSMKYNAPSYPLLSSRDIRKGWNFIPVSPEMNGKSINDLKGNCVYELVYTYAEEDGITQWLNLASVLDDKRLLGEASASGLQLVIKVRDDCLLGGVVPQITEGCTDTDGGKDYYTKGHINCPEPCYYQGPGMTEMVKSGSVDTDDACLQGINSEGVFIDNLLEYYCKTVNGVRGAISEEYVCPKGCEDGACIE